MYLFTRTARLAPGNQAAAMNWAFTITEKVNQVTELEANLWRPLFSAGVTTLTWTALVEDLAVLEASDAKLMADTGFQLLADEGAHIMMTGTSLDDTLDQFVTQPDMPADAPTPNYSNVVEATLAPGQYAKGIEIGLKIAEQASKVTGLQISFLSGVTGNYGRVLWVGTCDTIQELQAANEAIGRDPTLLKLIDEDGAKAYQPHATQTCYHRLG